MSARIKPVLLVDTVASGRVIQEQHSVTNLVFDMGRRAMFLLKSIYIYTYGELKRFDCESDERRKVASGTLLWQCNIERSKAGVYTMHMFVVRKR
jgi:hypothetical protein